jgi:hypothetical protein
MIGNDTNLVGGALQIDVPILERQHNAQKFLVVNIIVFFGGVYLRAPIRTWMKMPVVAPLRQNATGSCVGGVGLYYERLFEVGMD